MSNTLKLYNTLTRSKEPFAPLDPSNVRMYVCGPTVYDFAHIGNARPVIVFDVLFRLLRHIYGENHVTYARNITDVDDKINQRAFERWNRTGSLTGEIRKLTDGTLAQFHKDIDALGALRPTHEPRATDFVANAAQSNDMVRIIQSLVDRGHAYVAEGHVLFNVPSMPDYGQLARRNSDDMIAGARVDVAPYKKSPMDFVLWKPSNPETEPGWDSPWGYGRPGWHIECSAMSGALLGETFDIHAGGLDLIFPHHENEIAQSRCAFGTALMAQVWMHNGFLQVEGQKMSKSLGNFVTIQNLYDGWQGMRWTGDVIRLAMLSTHYSKPIDWTRERLLQSIGILRRWEKFAEGMYPDDIHYMDAIKKFGADITCARMRSILSDDLNTPDAIAYLHSLVAEADKNPSDMGRLRIQMHMDLKILGIDLRRFKAELSDALGGKITVPNANINALIATRNAARAAKDFAESDRLRGELEAMGLQLKDGKDADGNPVTTWEVKR